ncbi:MAG: GTP-binding protein [Candidatus Micrarchaeota archaeon]|nr:GTP-binding protein [Candidatus Micrarchaeota archaeon]
MGIEEKLRELEEELARTQKNKATEYHIGLLKAKIAKLKRELVSPKKAGARLGGFDVKKSGDATVVFIGLPSVGKSTLLNALTGAKSKTASYAFTTLSCIPGVMEYGGAKIQLLDLPGIIIGAHEGKGRGREVLAVARSADLVLIMLDVFQPGILPKIKEELAGMGIRLDEEPPKIFITKKLKGGIEINSTVKLTKLDEKTIIGVLNEYGVHNATVVFRQDASIDQLIDVLAANRRYVPSLVVLNKVDMVGEEYLKALGFDFVPISAEKGLNIEKLKKEIFGRLSLIRVYTKPRMEEADLKEPMMLRKGSTIEDACNKLHRDLVRDFKYALVWGKSAKFPGQKVGLQHVLEEGDIFSVVKKQG